MQLRTGLLAVLLLFWFPALAPAAGGTSKAKCAEGDKPPLYQEVLDLALPLKLTVPASGSLESVIVVRKAPGGNEPESYLVLRRYSHGGLGLRFTKPATSLFEQINEILDRAPDLELPQVCGQLTFTTRESEAPTRPLRRAVIEFLGLRFQPTLAADVYLDAPRYDIVVLTPMNQLAVTLYGPNMQSKRPHELIAWSERMFKLADDHFRQQH